MPIQITAALSFIIALIIVWHTNKNIDTGDSLILSILITNPRSQGCPRFQSGEELANSVGRINAYYSL